MPPSSGWLIVIEVDTGAIPKVRHDVRRRRYGAVTWLIRKNDWYRIDKTGDLVWLCCEDGISLAGIATKLADALETDLREALAATILTISRFQAHGLVEAILDLRSEATS